MSLAHVLQIDQPRAPLDVEMAALKQEFSDHDQASHRMKKRLYAGWLRWKDERSTAMTDYLRNAYPDFDRKLGTAFSALYVGAALAHGFEASTSGELDPFGWSLVTAGKTPDDLHELAAKHGMEEASKLLRRERSKTASEATTTRRMPESAADTLDGLSRRLQELPDMPVEDTGRRGMLVKMLDAAPSPVFEALATMAGTGENTMDALSAVLDAHTPDVYEELKRGGCMVPGCETRLGIELHHFARTADSTKRSTDLLTPTCRYHHNQDGSHDHAHAMTRQDFFDLWGGETEFLWTLLDRYSDAMQAVKRKRA